MNKLCEFFKKYDGIIGTVVFALLAVYGLCMATPAANCLYYQDTLDFYDQIMPGNDLIIYLSIFGIVWSVIYTTLRNQIRKVYYISNFVWHGVYAVFAIVAGILALTAIVNYQTLYLQLPFDAMNEYWSSHDSSYTISAGTPVFALGYVLCVVIILSAVPVAFVAIYQAIKRFKKQPTEAEVKE
ncbi:MAG: hypothetical protein Q4F15_03300 [Bacillota bacterium]|nr:hypothetical protein [Bacillota bacterium]